ncbi:MAG TPA: hypothetical protein VF338_04465 [Leptolinea sp.]
MSTPPEAAQPMPDLPEDGDSDSQSGTIQRKPKWTDNIGSFLIWIRSTTTDQHNQHTGLFGLILVILLAGIPPALVVADRWIEVLKRDVLSPIWCESQFLCDSMLPSYFVVVFFSIALLLVVLFIQRNQFIVVDEHPLEPIEQNPVENKQAKIGLYYIYAACFGFAYILIKSLIQQQLPGWSLVYIWLAFMLGCCLRVVHLDSITTLWKRERDLWIAMMLTHVSIVAFLVGLYSEPSLLLAMTVLLILALANIWRFRKQVPLIFWIVSLALVVFTIDINSWRTAAVGDEYDFQMLAWKLARTSYQDFGEVLFKADGAHGSHPFFSSALQVISMKFFGTENFGWRFSNPYLCTLSVGLYYLFCKSFASKRLSLTAAFLLAVSSCLMSFSKIGYNNLQALFALSLILAATTWSLRYRNLFSFACLGSLLAFCFYIYPAGLYLVPLPFLLLLLYDFPPTWKKVRLWVFMVLVFAALIFPLMLQPVFWQTKVPGTFMNQPELVGSAGIFMEHILSNVLYASFTFLFITNESHFIAASYLDPISSGLFIIGFCILLFQIRRQRFPLFILLTYIYFIFIIGASHDRTHPPNTRMFLFIPLYALITAWGVFWIKEKIIQVFSLKNGIPVIATAIFAVLMTAINLYQGYPLSYFRFSNNQSFESLFLRVSERVSEADPNVTKTYVVIVDQVWGVDGFLMMQKVYPSLAYAKIEQIRLSDPVLPDSTFPLLADKDTIVIFFAGMDKHWVKPLDTQLRNLGKVPCEITTTVGDQRFTLYHPPDQPQACYP